MTHLTPDELFRYVHGLLDDPEDALAQAHLESCSSCPVQAERLRAERSVLENACTDSHPPHEEVHAMTALVASLPTAPVRPAPRPRFASMSMGLTLAASVLGAIVAGSLFLSQQAAIVPPVQEQPAGSESEEARLRRVARDFLGENEAARLAAKADLLKAGHLSIRILLEERQGRPATVFHRASDLLFTLRFQGVNTDTSREFRMGMSRTSYHDDETRRRPLSDFLDDYPLLAESDPDVELPTPEVCEVNPNYRILDLLLDQVGLDYAFRFGYLIVAPPESLWPFPAPEAGRKDPEALKRQLARLDSAHVAERDEAERAIRGLGTWVLESLRPELKSGSAEYQARVKRIFDSIQNRLKPPRFAPSCTMDAQTLSPHGGLLRQSMLDYRVEVYLPDFGGRRLDVALLLAHDLRAAGAAAGTMDPSKEMPVMKCSDFLADTQLARKLASPNTISINVRELLVVLTRTAPETELDFCIVDGTEPYVFIDSKAEIAKIVAAQNAAREAERKAAEGTAK